MSVYDPLIPIPSAYDSKDLERVQAEFENASRPFLGSVATWLAWALLLPAAALITRRLPQDAFAPVLLVWSAAILVGGAIEAFAIYRRAQRHPPTPLGSWALRIQGNLSLVALALSAFLVWRDLTWAIPGVWLLLLGHSLFLLGGLAFPPFRLGGIAYQLGGLVALAPLGIPLESFAVTTALANLWIAFSIYRRHPGGRPRDGSVSAPRRK